MLTWPVHFEYGMCLSCHTRPAWIRSQRNVPGRACMSVHDCIWLGIDSIMSEFLLDDSREALRPPTFVVKEIVDDEGRLTGTGITFELKFEENFPVSQCDVQDCRTVIYAFLVGCADRLVATGRAGRFVGDFYFDEYVVEASVDDHWKPKFSVLSDHDRWDVRMRNLFRTLAYRLTPAANEYKEAWHANNLARSDEGTVGDQETETEGSVQLDDQELES